ncbi:hypothetical protein WMO64_14015 [Pseudoflavonifractor sp. CLA-AP-H29]|uniref:Uncharacterized protein n=1 Tax=Pseudoflavonifractor intestinihominis TaxID=3133171 RepID=A0ABV1EB78_9FIRM
MNTGFGKHTLVFEVDVNNDELISRLLKLQEKASDVAAEAGRIILELRQAEESKS